VIDAWLTGKDYSLVPEGAAVIGFSVREDFAFALQYAPKSRLKKTAESFRADRYPIRGRLAKGLRLTARAVVGCVGLEGAGAEKEAAPEGAEAEKEAARPAKPERKPEPKKDAKTAGKAAAEAEGKPASKPAPKPTEKPAAKGLLEIAKKKHKDG
jgi:hypothetical protein